MADSIANKTCGALFKPLFDRYAGNDPVKVGAFAAGYIIGTAEKIHLGACDAGMFRVGDPHRDWFRVLLAEIAEHYGLQVVELDYQDTESDQIIRELWLCRDELEVELVREFPDMIGGVNGPAWHRWRGLMCGVPGHAIDENFHKREGYGKKCD